MAHNCRHLGTQIVREIALGSNLLAKDAVKVIKAIEAEQTERDGRTDRNDRMIGVATHAHTHDHVVSLSDRRPQMVEEIEAFFEHYNRLAGKAFKPVKRSDAEATMVLVRESMKALDQG